jgi:hypothetical protein
MIGRRAGLPLSAGIATLCGIGSGAPKLRRPSFSGSNALWHPPADDAGSRHDGCLEAADRGEMKLAWHRRHFCATPDAAFACGALGCLDTVVYGIRR